MFSKEKTKRLIERAKELQKNGYNNSQLSKTFGVDEEWFIQHLPKATKPKAKPKSKKSWYDRSK